MSSTSTQAHLPIAEDYPNELRIHVAFVLNMEDDNAYHVFEVADITGVFIFPVAPENLSGLLKCALDLARRTPRRAGEEKYRDLNEFLQPFVTAFEGGDAIAKIQAARPGEDELRLGKPKEKAIALGDGKKGMLQWVSKKATLILHERKAKKAAKNKVIGDTDSGATTLVGVAGIGKDTDAISVKTTRTVGSFFAKDGDWCKTKNRSSTKKSAHSFFFFFSSSKKSSRPKATAADIRAEYLARGPAAVASPAPRDPSALSVPIDARHSVVSGPDWSRKDLWDDETVEALFMNDRFAQNSIFGGPLFE
jgi:hypothetical protein